MGEYTLVKSSEKLTKVFSQTSLLDDMKIYLDEKN